MPASMSMSMSTIAASEQTWAAGLEALPWEAQTNVPKRLRTLTKAMTELGSKMGRRRDTIYVDAPPSLVNITIVRGTSLREDVRQQRKDELSQKAVRAAGSVLALAAWYSGRGCRECAVSRVKHIMLNNNPFVVECALCTVNEP
ncbi:hypothetical protein NFJ02_12g08660 [Pycnococcus provasolii]